MKLALSITALAIHCVLSTAAIAAPNQSDGMPKTDRNIELWPKSAYQVKAGAALEARVAKLLATMTLEQKVAQLIQPEIRDFSVEEMRRYGFGSYLNGGGSFPGNNSKATAADWVALADAMYQAAIDDSQDGIAIPPIWGTDAVHGHGNVLGATLFPHNIGLGATRDESLIREIAAATAKEVRATGIDWVFAPTVAMVDNLRWGRTYEGYARDPELIQRYGKAFVEGMQGPWGEHWLDASHTLATVKHFIGDGGTTNGDDRGDTQVDESTLIARHAQGYFGALAAGAQTVMASFNSWNGEKLHGSHYLLTDVLKGRMGFDGLVVGDWLGHGFVPGCDNEHCAAAINAGVDILMAPGDSWRALYPNTIADVKAGVISAERLDDAVSRILRVKMRAGLFEAKTPSARPFAADQEWIGHPSHRLLARQAVAKSLVLLKNNQNVLPIKAGARVLVIGDGADNIPKQSGGWSMTWQGTEVTNADFPGSTSIMSGLQSALAATGGEARLSVDGKIPTGFSPDLVLAVIGENPYAEGNGDLDNLEYQRGDKRDLALLNAAREHKLPLVTVLLSGRPLWMNPEINASDAFVAAWLPGTEGAGVADVLVAGKDGKPQVDFKGTMPFPWPSSPLADGYDADPKSDAEQHPPLYKVGEGLNYQSKVSLPRLNEDTGISDVDSARLEIFNKAIKAPWHLAVGNSNGMHKVGAGLWQQGDWSVRSVNRLVQEDARRFTLNAPAMVSFSDDFSMDLRRFDLKDSYLDFSMAVESVAAGEIAIGLSCESGCQAKVPLAKHLKADGQWRQVSIPLSCLVANSDSLRQVFSPMTLDVEKGADLQLADVAIVKGKPVTEALDCNGASILVMPVASN
ncbi:exo 1,3/1,4-beta-D-glucan glucohydrolase [Shewanella sp. A25]|nr:exo 1,3/1,4-beta-D-glucan glucohydrolase [Shewanella shenzhenensis]